MDLDCEEFRRWYSQAKHTFGLIDTDIVNEGYSWACFKAQQAGEMALKSVLKAVGRDSFGHGLLRLYRDCTGIIGGDPDITGSVSYLDKLYITPRYPDAFTEGSPWEHFTKGDATLAKDAAEKILAWAVEKFRACL